MSVLGVCHGGPLFCTWGRIDFGGSLGKWVIARKSDGAVVSQFVMGRGDILIFKTPLKAARFLEGHEKWVGEGKAKALRGKPCLLRLHNVHYSDHTPREGASRHRLGQGQGARHWRYVGRFRGLECFDWFPPKEWEGTTYKWFEYNWARAPWVRWEVEEREFDEMDRIEGRLWHYGNRENLNPTARKRVSEMEKRLDVLRRRREQRKKGK